MQLTNRQCFEGSRWRWRGWAALGLGMLMVPGCGSSESNGTGAASGASPSVLSGALDGATSGADIADVSTTDSHGPGLSGVTGSASGTSGRTGSVTGATGLSGSSGSTGASAMTDASSAASGTTGNSGSMTGVSGGASGTTGNSGITTGASGVSGRDRWNPRAEENPGWVVIVARIGGMGVGRMDSPIVRCEKQDGRFAVIAEGAEMDHSDDTAMRIEVEPYAGPGDYSNVDTGKLRVDVSHSTAGEYETVPSTRCSVTVAADERNGSFTCTGLQLKNVTTFTLDVMNGVFACPGR